MKVVREAAARFAKAGIPDAQAEAEFLAAGILNIGRLDTRTDRTMTSAEARRLRNAVARRLRREPLAYILGTQPFAGVDLLVKPGVLIPRPETEDLVEAVSGGNTILDLCTGSGAIAIALAKKRPGASVTAVEISPAALRVARANAKRNQAKVRFLKGDLFSPLRRSSAFDIIVSNPPYIRSGSIAGLSPEVRREPRLALDGGRSGLDLLERIVDGAPAYLKPGGLLALEMDPAQTGPIARRMAKTGFKSVEIRKDSFGRKRIVLGVHG